MSIIEAIILGIIQGLTEFLPVSSSGHLIISERILGVEIDSLAFELVMHVGTLTAVVFAYKTKLIDLIKNPLSKQARLLIVATLPTVIIVFVFNSLFLSAFDGRYLIYCFLITALLLLIANRSGAKVPKGAKSAKKNVNNGQTGRAPLPIANQCRDIGYFDALIIGITQGFAAFPGISRSGSTISVSMLLGNDRAKSADFSLILSIPIIIGSTLVELTKPASLSGIGILPLILGFFAAFLSGLLAIKILLSLLKKLSLDAFAVYLFLLSLFLLLNDNFLFLF